MDITTILGIIIGAGLIVWSIIMGGDIGGFVDIPSILIVVGGTFAAVLASFPLGMLKNTIKHNSKLMSGKQFNPQPIIETLITFAMAARKNGLLALESEANNLKDPFFRQGILLAVDGVNGEKIRDMLETEMAMMDKRHGDETAIYEKAAAYAPAFGMIGTLIGLINMLAAMSLESGSSDTLGASMATAMVTTLYGCIMANLIFLPVAHKLKVRNEEELLYKQIIVEGVIGIQSGENPKTLREKLASLLHEKKKMKVIATESQSSD